MDPSLLELDCQRLPLVVVRTHGQADAETHVDFFRRYRELAEKVGRFAVLVDCRSIDGMHVTPVLRRVIVDEYRASKPALEKALVAEARVVSSAVMRGVLTAIDWMTPSRWPTATFTSMQEAERWLGTQLHEIGMLIPSEPPQALRTPAPMSTLSTRSSESPSSLR